MLLVIFQAAVVVVMMNLIVAIKPVIALLAGFWADGVQRCATFNVRRLSLGTQNRQPGYIRHEACRVDIMIYYPSLYVHSHFARSLVTACGYIQPAARNSHHLHRS